MGSLKHDRNPYSRNLFPRRRNDDDGEWLYYECSQCGKVIETPENDSELLKSRFIEHVKGDHPRREDANQAAMLVVRKATSRL